jgi:hypothetical protein
MRINYKSIALLSTAIGMLMLYGCSKNEQVAPAPEEVVPHHVYGVLPATPDMYANIPRYSAANFQNKLDVNSITPPPISYTLVNPDVRDQGQIGSCTSFCGAEAYEIGYYYKNNHTFPAVVSPAFIYYEERVNILHQSISTDQGAYMVDIGQSLQTYGVCPESLYIYPSSDKSTAYKTPPNAAAISAALGYKVTGNTLINSGDVAAVKNLLLNNIPVMMGLNIYDNAQYKYFEGLNTTSYTYNPLTSTGALAKGVRLLGGHATPIIGYDDNLQVFLVQNSWGTSWGNHGFYYMPYSVFMSTKVVPAGGVYYLTL